MLESREIKKGIGGDSEKGGYEDTSDEFWPAKSQETHAETENVDEFTGMLVLTSILKNN